MRRRGDRGWRRWLWGAWAATILFGVFITTIAAAASGSTAQARQAGDGSNLCIPLVTCIGTPTPTISVGGLQTPTHLLPTATPSATLPLPTCLPIVCTSSTPPVVLPPITSSPTPKGNGGPPTSPTGQGGGGPTAGPTSSGGGPAAGGGSLPGSGGSGGNPAAPGAPASTPYRPGSAEGGAPDPAANGLILPPPPPIELAAPASSLTFGKAPFLWPLFIGLDVLALAAMVWVLRRTWAKPSAD